MNRSLREVLAESHVAAVAIALLVFFSFNACFSAMWPLVLDFIAFVFTAIAIFDIPYFSTDLGSYNSLGLELGIRLYTAVVALLGAWALSRWVYRKGPFRCLGEYRMRLLGRKNA